MAIKLAGTVPPDHNGLASIYRQLVADPQREHIIIAIVDVKQLATDTDTEVVTPTIRMRHVEVVLPESAGSARAMMQRAMEARTGDTVLPFPDAFDNVTPIR